MRLLRSKWFYLIVFLLVGFLHPHPGWALDTSASQAASPNAQDYKAFQKLFTWIQFQSLYVPWDKIETTGRLSGTALKFLPENWQEGLQKWPDTKYEAISAFHFNRNLDAYLILGPSQLNGANVNLLIFDARGHLLDNEIVAGRVGDEGNYQSTFGWIKDINGDHQPDILNRFENCEMPDDGNGNQVCTADEFSAKVWDKDSFANYDLPDKENLKKETDEDVGNTMLRIVDYWIGKERGDVPSRVEILKLPSKTAA